MAQAAVQAKKKETVKSVIEKIYEDQGVGTGPMRFLLKGNRAHLMIRPKESIILDVFDGTRNVKTKVSLRYCAQYNDPSVDYQNSQNLGEPKELESINLYGGELIVGDSDPCLQKYMALHSKNVANGGVDFVLYDPKKEARARAAEKRIKNKAIRLVDEAAPELIDIVGTVLTKDFSGQFKEQDADIKYNKLSDLAESDPEEVIEAFEDKDNKLLYSIFEAVASNIVKFKNGEVVWGSGPNRNDVIITNGLEDPVLSLLAFFKTTNGGKAKNYIIDALQ